MSSFSEQRGGRKVRLPVRRVGGHWEFFYGGDVPVKEGAIAEMNVNMEDITDGRFREQVTKETIFQVLTEGAPLLVALSSPSRETKPQDYDVHQLPSWVTRLEMIHLGPLDSQSPQLDLLKGQNGGGLWLRFKGLERCDLLCSSILMPQGFPESTAISLNHAFTLLSKAYETQRISNTGNVYTRIYYRDADGRWYPLDDLRRGAQASTERQLIQRLWKDVENKLGWRPVPASTPKSGKKP